MKKILFVSILLWCMQTQAGDGAGAGVAPRTPPRMARTEVQRNIRAGIALERYLLGGPEQKANLARAQAAAAAAGRAPIRPMRPLG